MTNNNPFTISFGEEPINVIKRLVPFNTIKSSFLKEEPTSRIFLITGVRGSGKTVLLSSLSDCFRKEENWIVIELNPQLNLLEGLAAKIYDECKFKYKFSKKSFSFSFHGLSFSISGEKPVANIESLLDLMFEEIKKEGKKVLVCIDEVTSNQQMKTFALEFQMLIRKHYPLFLLMTGLYENIRNLQEHKDLTFLYRAMKITLSPLNLLEVSNAYEEILKVSKENAVSFAKLTNGYAFAFQVLGYLLFEDDIKVVDNGILDNYDSYLKEYVYDKIWNDSSKLEKDILFALNKSKSGTVKSIKDQVKMTTMTFSSYRDRLIKKGVLYSPSYGYLSFTLPRFKEFINGKLLFLNE